MSAKRKAKREREARRAANLFAHKQIVRTPPAPPPSEREELTPEIEAMLSATANCKDVPLQMLRIHSCHGDRDPYKDTPEGFARRARLSTHIRDAGGWDNLACEVLTVSVHKDESYWIIDGVGRLYMADVLAGGVVNVLPCRLLYGLTHAQEHKLFKRLGTQRTKVSPYDVWRDSGSDDVKPITALKAQFGHHMPKVQLPVLRFCFEQKCAKSGEPTLERAVALVANTALGSNNKYTSVMTGAVAAILATQPNFDECRFRDVLPDDPAFSYRLFTKAQRATIKLGYLKPHNRTVAWQVAILLIDDWYNPNLGRDRKLIAANLDAVSTAFHDAYSVADPAERKAAAKLKVVSGTAA